MSENSGFYTKPSIHDGDKEVSTTSDEPSQMVGVIKTDNGGKKSGGKKGKPSKKGKGKNPDSGAGAPDGIGVLNEPAFTAGDHGSGIASTNNNQGGSHGVSDGAASTNANQSVFPDGFMRGFRD